jgi:DNA-binding NtrC family response regulator
MKTRVLIVDDEEKFSGPLAERLALRDYDVTTSNSGEDAVAKVKQYNYDVVVLDVLMPGMSGIETLGAIKEIKPLTEIIMLTGHATVESAVEGMKLGASDFLMKPCETEDLVSKIQKAHDRKAEQDDRIREAKAQDIIASPRSVLKK